MGSRAFGELLLRPSTFTRIAPITPITPAARFTCFTAAWPAQRGFSSTAVRSAQGPQSLQSPSTAANPEVAASPPRPAARRDANSAIDDLFANGPDAAASNNNNNNSNNSRNNSRNANEPFGTSLFGTSAPPSNPGERVFGASFSKPSRVARRPNLQFEDMLPADSLANPSLANKPNPSTLATQQAAAFENYPRLNPTYGRSVELDASRGRDIVRGIGMLGSLVARNRVKRDFQTQRYHERGGLKRKRLNSERWRRRFNLGFKHVTARVMELTRKGW